MCLGFQASKKYTNKRASRGQNGIERAKEKSLVSRDHRVGFLTRAREVRQGQDAPAAQGVLGVNAAFQRSGLTFQGHVPGVRASTPVRSHPWRAAPFGWRSPPRKELASESTRSSGGGKNYLFFRQASTCWPTRGSSC